MSTATDLANLLQRRSNIYAELAAMTSANNGGHPTFTEDGKTVNHNEYKAGLYTELTSINLQISALEGPWEERLEGMV